MAQNSEQRVVEIIVNGQKAQASIKEMGAAAKILWNQLSKMSADDPGRAKLIADYREMKGRLDEATKSAKGMSQAMDQAQKSTLSFKTIFSAVFAAFSLQAVIQQVINFGMQAYELAKQYSDAFADIRKSTGMTADEVKVLNSEISKIHTRTAQKDLLDIAKVGGQIGIAKNEMLGFVEATDKAVVALGDEFAGGAEEVAKEMGSLQKLFKETKDLDAGTAINNIGSAINELGAAGTATGPVVAEFAKRIGQLGDLAPQIDQTLGLGAAMQELGLSAEISAGGLTNIFLKAGEESAAFAKQIGMSTGEFRQLLNSNPNEMLLKLAESMKGMSNTQIVDTMGRLKLGTQESIKVMSLLANQTDMVREKQELASKAMKEGTSLTNEFAIKNNTAAAQAEKNAKKIEAIQLAIGQGLIPVMNFLFAVGETVWNALADGLSYVGEALAPVLEWWGKLADAMGFTGDAGGILSGILKVLGKAFEVTLIPLKIVATLLGAMAAGFNYAYEKSGLFRGAIDVLLFPIKTLIALVSDAYNKLSAFSDTVSNLLGMAGKKTDVKATVTTEKKNTVSNTTTNTTTGSTPPPVADDYSYAADEKAAEKEAKAKAAAERAAEKKKKEDERRAAEMEKLRKDFADKSLKADAELETLRAAVQDDAHASKLAKIENAYAKQLALLNQNELSIRENMAISEEEKNALLAQYREQRDLAAQEYEQQKKAVEEEKKKADKEAAIEELELAEQEELLRLEEKFLNSVNAEQAKEDALYEIKKKALEDRLALELASGTAERETVAKIRGEILAIEKEHNAQKVENVKKTEELKKAIFDQGIGFAKEALNLGIDLLSKDEQARKKNAGLIKAFSIGTIVANLAQEVSGYMAHPGNIASLGVVGGVKAAFAAIRAAIAIRNVTAQKFAGGGYTGPGLSVGASGHLVDSTGFNVAGVVHQDEWVAPKWMVEHPKFANVIGYLESSRRRGFAEGGFTSPADAVAATPNQGSQAADQLVGLMTVLIEETRAYRQELSTWQRELEVVNDPMATFREANSIKQIRNDASI